MESGSVNKHDAIATRAYRCWEIRGCPVGSPEVDWLEAEKEFRAYLDSQSLPFSSISMEAVTN
ncbi:MAG: hypothetical protein JWN70_1666 [Planctomycetaceae bacterium]|nr:hypothetical protein [Planctomycetaceae bacterium]